MCGCGRRRTDQTTSVQAAQDAHDAQAALAEIERQMISDAEMYAKSQASAIGNSRS
jgi:hypothetical protein